MENKMYTIVPPISWFAGLPYGKQPTTIIEDTFKKDTVLDPILHDINTFVLCPHCGKVIN